MLCCIQHMLTAETLGFSIEVKDIDVIIPEGQEKRQFKLTPLNKVLVGQVEFFFIKVEL